MKITAFAASLAALAGAAGAQQFTLEPGHLEYRIIADRFDLPAFAPPDDRTAQLALQVRYVGGDVRAASLGATRGRIVSSEVDSFGVLTRTGVRQPPFGNNDFGFATRQGMTEGHRELFAGGTSNNNADQNGGNPSAASGLNPHNGGGEFRWAPGLAGFGHVFAFDNAATGVGRSDGSGDGLLISVGLIDDNNGGGNDTGLEPTDGQSTDSARWDTIFLFNYTATNFQDRIVSFDYQPLGSAENPGVTEDTVHWWDSSLGNFRTSNAAAGVFRDDLSYNLAVYTIFPAPGSAGLLALGGIAAARRRRA